MQANLRCLVLACFVLLTPLGCGETDEVPSDDAGSTAPASDGQSTAPTDAAGLTDTQSPSDVPTLTDTGEPEQDVPGALDVPPADPCADLVCPEQATCDAGECLCDAYYEPFVDDTCQDINECLIDDGGCLDNTVCENQMGAPPVCACAPGYVADADGVCAVSADCVDVACVSDSHCVDGACVCDAGFAMDPSGLCQDIDDCLVDNGGCALTALCINQDGAAATCVCEPGLEMASNGECVTPTSCVDVLCGVDAYCADGVCSCGAGYAMDAAENCQDVDECLVDNGGCGDAQFVACQNTPGSMGCADIDECLNFNGGCGDYASCTNEEGAPPVCSCLPGYQVDADGLCAETAACAEVVCGSDSYCDDGACLCSAGFSEAAAGVCEDVDECLTDNGGCGDATFFDCTNTAGAFSCADVDECLVDNGGCGPLATCTNVTGGVATCACKPGYSATADGVCAATPACEGVSCGDNAFCDNGECACFAGFLGDADGVCADIDECAAANAGCGDAALTECSNTLGAYDCVDVDECATDNGGCGEYAVCTNQVAGPPECDCAAGLMPGADGDCEVIPACLGVACPAFSHCEQGLCACDAGFGADLNGFCQDLDECQSDNGGCGNAALVACINAIGGATCEDIDECATDNGDCGEHATCQDQEAAPVVCVCEAGFVFGTDGTCVQPGCQSIVCEGASHCEDAACVCDAGYEAGADGACVDVDECATENGGCPEQATCVNVAGGAPSCEGPISGDVGAQLVVDGDVSGESFSVDVSASLELGPFAFEATGTASKEDADSPITWCVSGLTAIDVGLFSLTDVEVTVCDDGSQQVTVEFTGLLTLEGETAAVEGTFDGTAEPWSLSVSATELTFLSLTADTLDFTYAHGEQTLELGATTVLPGPLALDLSGSFAPEGNVVLSAGLQEDATWEPLPGFSDFSFTALTGSIAREDGQVSVAVAASADTPLSFIDGMTLEDVSLTASYEGGDWGVSLEANTVLGPIGAVTLAGSLNASDDTVTGCLGGTVTDSIDVADLGFVHLTNTLAEVCLASDKTLAVTLGTDVEAMGASYEGLEAHLAIGVDIPLRLPGSKLDLPFGTRQLDTGEFRLPNGIWQLADGTFQLPDGLTLPEGAVWDPLTGLITWADGLIHTLDGTFTLPGALTLPNGWDALPFGALRLAADAVQLPDLSVYSALLGMRWIPGGSAKPVSLGFTLPDGVKDVFGHFLMPNGMIVSPSFDFVMPAGFTFDAGTGWTNAASWVLDLLSGAITLPSGKTLRLDGSITWPSLTLPGALTALPFGVIELPADAVQLPDLRVYVPSLGALLHLGGGSQLAPEGFTLPAVTLPVGLHYWLPNGALMTPGFKFVPPAGFTFDALLGQWSHDAGYLLHLKSGVMTTPGGHLMLPSGLIKLLGASLPNGWMTLPVGTRILPADALALVDGRVFSALLGKLFTPGGDVEDAPVGFTLPEGVKEVFDHLLLPNGLLVSPDYDFVAPAGFIEDAVTGLWASAEGALLDAVTGIMTLVNGDLLGPAGRLSLASAVSLPNGWKTLPFGTVHLPLDALQLPDLSVYLPSIDTLLALDGTLQPVGLDFTLPEGVKEAFGHFLLPNGVLVGPGFSFVAPAGFALDALSGEWLNEAGARFNAALGHLTLPDGSLKLPTGGLQLPSGDLVPGEFPVPDSGWRLDIPVPELAISDEFSLMGGEISIADSGRFLGASGAIDLTIDETTVSLEGRGAALLSGDFFLQVGLVEDTTWTPMPDALDLTFTTLSGKLQWLDKVLSGSMEAVAEADLAVDSLSLTGASLKADVTLGGVWSLEVGASAEIVPVGTAEVLGTYDSATKTLCVSGESEVALSETSGAMEATICVADKAVTSIEFSGEGSFPPVGTVSVTGSYDGDEDRLCLGGQADLTLPGGDTGMQLDVCLIEEAKTVESVLFSGQANFEPVGDIALDGSYDKDAKTLCMAGETSIAIPSTPTNLKAAACFITGDDSALELDTLSFEVKVEVEPVGMVEFAGDYDSGTSLLCMNGETEFTLPGSEVKMMATACINMMPDADPSTPDVTPAPTLESLVFSGNASFEPVGPISLEGTYVGGELCLEGDTEQAFPGTDVMLLARACLDTSNPTSPVLNTLTFNATVAVDPVGEVALSGTYADGRLCFEGESTLTLPGADAGLVVAICADMSGSTPILEEASFSGTLTADPFGDVSISGTYVAADASLCLEGSVEGDTSNWLPVPGLNVHDVMASACLVDGSFSEAAFKTAFTLGNDASQVTLMSLGAYEAGGDMSLELGLAPGCLDADAGTCGAYEVGCDETCDGTWTPFAALGVTDDLKAVTFTTLTGSLTKTDGEYGLSATAGLGLGEDGGALTIIAGVDGGAPIFALQSVEMAIKLTKDGETGETGFSIKLGGTSEIDFVGTPLVATISAEVTQDDLSFTGTVAVAEGTPPLEPLKELIGEGKFAIGLDNPLIALTTEFAGPTLSFEFQASSSLSVLDATVTPTVAVKATLGGGTPAITILGIIDSLVIPVGEYSVDLGEAGSIMFAASTADDVEVQLAGAEEPIVVGKGVTLQAEAKMTPLEGLVEDSEDLKAVVSVRMRSLTKIELMASIKSNFQLIAPSYEVPGINELRSDELDVTISIENSKQSIALAGSVKIFPKTKSGQVLDVPVIGTAAFDINSKRVLGGTVSLQGQWNEPFFIPKVSMMNPGLTIALMVQWPPIPMRVGFNGDLLYLRSDIAWPEFALDAGSPIIPDDLKTDILTGGGTLIIDAMPTESGIGVAGVNVPLPTVITRFNLEGVNFDELFEICQKLNAAGQTLVQTGVDIYEVGYPVLVTLPGGETLPNPTTMQGHVDAFKAATLAPDKSADSPDTGAYKMQGSETELVSENKLQAYFSTHDVNYFGVDFTTGIKFIAALKTTVTEGTVEKVKILSLTGALNKSGLRARAFATGDYFGIPGFASLAVVGDPYQHYMDRGTGEGYVEVAHDDRFNATQSIEGWLYADALYESALGHELVSKQGETGGGLLFGLGALAPSCSTESSKVSKDDDFCSDAQPCGVTHACMAAKCEQLSTCATDSECGDGAHCDAESGQCLACPRLNTVRALITDDAGATRSVETRYGVIRKESWHHVAYVQQDNGVIALLVDGEGALSVDSAGEDASLRILPGVNTAPLKVGPGLSRVDDVRLWAAARDEARIAGEPRILPRFYNRDDGAQGEPNPLIARYAFDFDKADLFAGLGLQDVDPVFYDEAAGAAIAHSTRLYPAAQTQLHGHYKETAFPMVQVEGNDIELKLLLSVDDPLKSGLWMRSGFALDLPFEYLDRSYAFETNLSLAEANGKLYSREFNPFIFEGPLGAIFISGSGPNFVEGDHDDGLYADYDLKAEPYPEVAFNGRLIYQDTEGDRTKVMSGDVLFGCNKADGCDALADYTLKTSGMLDLTIPLPAGALRISGMSIVDIPGEGGVNPVIQVSGVTDPDTGLVTEKAFVEAYGVRAEGDLLMDQTHLEAHGSLQIGMMEGIDFGVVQDMGVNITFEPFTFCAESTTVVGQTGASNVTIPGLGTFNGHVSACFGDTESFAFESTLPTLEFQGITMTDVSVSVNINCQAETGCPEHEGVWVSGKVDIPGLFNGSIEGSYKSETEFSLLGTSDIDDPANIFDLSTTFTMSMPALERLSPRGSTSLDGSNSTILDNMRVLCPIANSALTSVQLRNLGSAGDYRYSCSEPGVPLVGGPAVDTPSMTSTDNAGSGGIQFLDRHNVRCPEGSLLRGFDFEAQLNDTPPADLAHYKYWCVESAQPLVCHGRQTAPTGVANWQDFTNLASHAISCEENEFLQGFQLQVPAGGLNYDYTCCEAPQLPMAGMHLSVELNTDNADALVTGTLKGDLSMTSDGSTYVDLNGQGAWQLGGLQLAEAQVHFDLVDGAHIRGNAGLGEPFGTVTVEGDLRLDGTYTLTGELSDVTLFNLATLDGTLTITGGGTTESAFTITGANTFSALGLHSEANAQIDGTLSNGIITSFNATATVGQAAHAGLTFGANSTVTLSYTGPMEVPENCDARDQCLAIPPPIWVPEVCAPEVCTPAYTVPPHWTQNCDEFCDWQDWGQGPICFLIVTCDPPLFHDAFDVAEECYPPVCVDGYYIGEFVDCSTIECSSGYFGAETTLHFTGSVTLAPFSETSVSGYIESNGDFVFDISNDTTLIPGYAEYDMSGQLKKVGDSVTLQHEGAATLAGASGQTSGSAIIEAGVLQSMTLKLGGAAASGLTLKGVSLGGGTSASATLSYSPALVTLSVEGNLDFTGVEIEMSGSIDSAGQFSLAGTGSTTIAINGVSVDESIPGAAIVRETLAQLIATGQCLVDGTYHSLDQETCGCFAWRQETYCAWEACGLFNDCYCGAWWLRDSNTCDIPDSCFSCPSNGGTNSLSLNLGSVDLAVDYLIDNSGAGASATATYTYNGISLSASGSANTDGEVCASVTSGEIAKAAASNLGIDIEFLSVGSNFSHCINL